MGKTWNWLVAKWRDENDKTLGRQLVVTVIDKGLLGLVVVGIGLVGNWMLEDYKIRQAKIQAQAQYMLQRRLDSIQQLADAHGNLTSSFLRSTLNGATPSDAQVNEYSGLLERLFQLTNQYEYVLPESLGDELERELWIYKGITHEPPAQWPQYRGFVAELALAFEWAWRQSLPRFEGERQIQSGPPPFGTIKKSAQEVTQEGTQKYFELNLDKWQKQNAAKPAPSPQPGF